MDEREWEAWLAAAEDAALRFVSPCSDCTFDFARTMRLEGRCDRPWRNVHETMPPADPEAEA